MELCGENSPANKNGAAPRWNRAEMFVSQTKINPLLCRGMKDLQIKERAPVLV